MLNNFLILNLKVKSTSMYKPISAYTLMAPKQVPRGLKQTSLIEVADCGDLIGNQLFTIHVIISPPYENQSCKRFLVRNSDDRFIILNTGTMLDVRHMYLRKIVVEIVHFSREVVKIFIRAYTFIQRLFILFYRCDVFLQK